MKNPIILIIVLTLFLAKISQAQIPNGQVYDLDGTPISNWHKGLAYKPNRALKIDIILDDYITCKTVSNEGKIGELKIRVLDGHLETTRKDGYGVKKLKPKNYTYILFGNDSVFSFNGEYRQTEYIKNGSFFLWYIQGDDSVEFAMQFVVDPISQVNYFARKTGEKTWAKLKAGSHKKLEKELLLYMGHIAELKEDIATNKYNEKDISSLIKKLRYLNAWKANTPFNYDAFWKEQRNHSDSTHQIWVRSFDGNHWNLDFYHKGKLVQSGFYNSITPLSADGAVHSYDPNEKLHKTEFYTQDKLDSVHLFNPNGEVAYSYYLTLKDAGTIKPIYGKNYTLIAGNPVTTQTVLDTVPIHINGKTQFCYRKFEDGELHSSYYMEGKTKIYQMVSSNFYPQMRILQTKLYKFSDSINFASSIKAEAEGYTLLKLRVNEKGKIQSIETQYTPYDKHEKFILYFLNNKYEKSYSSLGKYKIDNVPVNYEVLLPVYFNLSEFSTVYRLYINPFSSHKHLKTPFIDPDNPTSTSPNWNNDPNHFSTPNEFSKPPPLNLPK